MWFAVIRVEKKVGGMGVVAVLRRVERSSGMVVVVVILRYPDGLGEVELSQVCGVSMLLETCQPTVKVVSLTPAS